MASKRKFLNALQQGVSMTLFASTIAIASVLTFFAGDSVRTIRVRRAEGRRIQELRERREERKREEMEADMAEGQEGSE